jgi:SAM-dependent methyltransferase
MAEKAYLSYYGERNIIPVRQDIENLPRHMARRQALYRHLGIQPLALRGCAVLEFGPGTGDNALYTASCGPALYVLVDGNPASNCALAEKIEQGLLPRDRIECRAADIREYADTRRFDVVLCEGVIPMQADPAGFTSHVASFVAPGGILVITTMSPASILAEICRRVLKPFFTSLSLEEDRLFQELVRFFQPDLRSLPGMSRRHEDWILDNILNPWPRHCTFTIPQAIDTLDQEFDVLGTSPCFVQDWRWYKSIPEHAQGWNDITRAEYNRWAEYLLDYRARPGSPGRLPMANLDAACEHAVEIQHNIWHSNSLESVPDFLDILRRIGEMVKGEMSGTAGAIEDFSEGVKQLLEGSPAPNFRNFRAWFGRGQQYVSFTRRAA